MKKSFILGLVVLVLVLTSIMSGCGSDTAAPAAVGTPTPASPAAAAEAATPTPDVQNAVSGETGDEGVLAAVLRDDYEDALSVRNQLALGTLWLEGTANAVTPEQAQELKLYWQALLALSSDSTTATEETTALQTQIVETMAPEQLEAINAMALTNANLNEFYVEQGVVLTTPEPGVTPQSGKNSNLSQEDREATKTAAEAEGLTTGSGGGGGAERRDILLNTLIELLTERAAES